MEDLYVKSVMAHAMDKIRFKLQNYFKGSKSKIRFDDGNFFLSIKPQKKCSVT